MVKVSGADAPAARVPEEGLTANHGAPVAAVQLIAEPLVLLTTKTLLAGVKGPPLSPTMFQPFRSSI